MSDPNPTPETTSEPTPDLEAVSLQGTYRIGYMPPEPGTLAPGEIYVQVPADGAAPALFVGGLDKIVVSMVTGTLPAAASASRKEDPTPPAAGAAYHRAPARDPKDYHRAPAPDPKEDPKERK